MEHVNNDMDDLFRKAGDLYPLKISESDWDGVLGKLRETENVGDQSSVPEGDARNKGRKRRWLALLFLIPLALGSVVYFTPSKKQSGAFAQPIDSKTISSPNAIVEKDNKHAGKDEQGLRDISAKPNPNAAMNPLPLASKKTRAASDFSLSSTRNRTNVFSKKDTPAKNRNGLTDVSNAEKGKEVAEIATATIPGKDANASGTESVQAQDTKTTTQANSASNENKSSGVKPSVEDKTIPATAETASKAKTNNIKAGASRGFYIGMIAGPDLSTVKFQSVKQTGFSLGARVGYRINKRFSVETGLIWDKKYYYSSAEYFKKDNAPPPPSNAIVNGNCSMFEIPLDLRFDFASGNNKHGFFVKTGLSSYLNMKENYSFLFVNYPNVNKSYDGPDNIFSILQISAGYEYAISGKTKIQVEPYMKIPLQGVGTGNMPISSLGIYFGITHSFR